jgi:hypothetical protein
VRRPSARHSAFAFTRPGRTTLTRQVLWFVVIGVASTVAQALLYWVRFTVLRMVVFRRRHR